ncbi:MAG: cell filamentation protein Fic [Butyrivibrio sp.]|nr:cell filamentation protein Fic [Butyrivibrio sp.]
MKAKYNMTPEQNIFLAKRNIVDYIWKSANLEGIGVTYPDTQAIYNGMSVDGYTIDDINAVNDLKHAWQFLLEHINDSLDLKFVRKVHMLLGKFTVINAGALRREEVRIGGTEWVPEVPDEGKAAAGIIGISESKVSPIEKALDMVLYLMRAQLFYDGNKRIAMLIGNKIMIENGQGVISVSQKDIKPFYSLLVRYYETGNGAELKGFLYDNCVDGMTFSESDKI